MLIVNLYSSWHQKPSPLPSEGYQKCGSCSAGLWGAVSSWLLHWTPDRAVRVRVPAGNIVLCSLARHHAHSASLSTQVYKWVPVSLMLGLTCDGVASRPGGIEIFLVDSRYSNRDELRLDGPLGSYADFTLSLTRVIYIIIVCGELRILT